MQNREQHTRLARNAREQRNSLRDYDTYTWHVTARGEQLRVCFGNKTSSETLNASPQAEQLESCARSAQKTEMLLKGP